MRDRSGLGNRDRDSIVTLAANPRFPSKNLILNLVYKCASWKNKIGQIAVCVAPSSIRVISALSLIALSATKKESKGKEVKSANDRLLDLEVTCVIYNIYSLYLQECI
uniref:Uncharacterized protein n=1 Tax=Bursaphelenchus xylophilus TaxID=6326 RepID=A0A1I7RQ00_BURXY